MMRSPLALSALGATAVALLTACGGGGGGGGGEDTDAEGTGSATGATSEVETVLAAADASQQAGQVARSAWRTPLNVSGTGSVSTAVVTAVRSGTDVSTALGIDVVSGIINQDVNSEQCSASGGQGTYSVEYRSGFSDTGASQGAEVRVDYDDCLLGTRYLDGGFTAEFQSGYTVGQTGDQGYTIELDYRRLASYDINVIGNNVREQGPLQWRVDGDQTLEWFFDDNSDSSQVSWPASVGAPSETLVYVVSGNQLTTTYRDDDGDLVQTTQEDYEFRYQVGLGQQFYFSWNVDYKLTSPAFSGPLNVVTSPPFVWSLATGSGGSGSASYSLLQGELQSTNQSTGTTTTLRASGSGSEAEVLSGGSSQGSVAWSRFAAGFVGTAR
jgi:hypothetical protein